MMLMLMLMMMMMMMMLMMVMIMFSWPPWSALGKAHPLESSPRLTGRTERTKPRQNIEPLPSDSCRDGLRR
eukprot:2077049-Pyramimonas_sp.AAC.1